jgi:uncharacterized small protein (DUF1192 family)
MPLKTLNGRSQRPIARRPDFELNARVKALEAELERQRRELATQFTRIAQLQAELDQVRAAWVNTKDSRGRA